MHARIYHEVILMEILNTAVNPPIRVVVTETTSLKLFNNNEYIDPEDGMRFNKSTLDAADKGHVYHTYKMANHAVRIHMPFRAYDAETQEVVRHLRTAKPLPPTVLTADSDYDRLLPIQCTLQHFQISLTDFLVFKRQATVLGWVCVEQEPNYQELTELLDDIYEDCRTFSAIYADVSGTLAGPVPVFTSMAAFESIMRAISNLAGLRTALDLLEADCRDLYLALLGFACDPARLAILSTRMGALASRFDKTCDLYSLGQEAVRNAQQSLQFHLGSPYSGKTTLPPLRNEIERLKKSYPALRFCTVTGSDELVIKLMGATLTISPTDVKFEGSPIGLMGTTTQEADTSAKGMSARLASVVRRKG